MRRTGAKWKTKLNAAPTSVINGLSQIGESPDPKQRLLMGSDGFPQDGATINIQATLSIREEHATLSTNVEVEPEDIHLSCDHFKPGDYVEVSSVQNHVFPETPKTSHFDQQRSGCLIVRLSENFLKANKEKKKATISLLKSIAEAHSFKDGALLYVRKVLDIVPTAKNFPSHITTPSFDSPATKNVPNSRFRFADFVADRIVITLKDQYVSRRDMWQLTQSLDKETLFRNKQVEFCEIRAKVSNIFCVQTQTQPLKVQQPFEVSSAIVRTNSTKFVFQSKSCQVYLSIEISREMFEFDESGFLQTEKCVLFIKSYLERLKAESNTHEILVFLHSRIFYPQVSKKEQLLELCRTTLGDPDLDKNSLSKLGAFQYSRNLIFQDVYLKVGALQLDTPKANYETLIQKIKEQIDTFPYLVNWQINRPQNVVDLMKNLAPKCKTLTQFPLPCSLARADQCNLLEVINLSLFNLNNEDMDINLRTTGIQLFILTAGVGVYKVNAGMVAPTKSRILLGGVPIQLISFARQPPFPTPLMINYFKNANPFQRQKLKLYQIENEGEEKFEDYQVVDWIEVAYLHHVKLLESHLQASNSLPLISISKTPLTSPSFAVFQQSELTRQVFQKKVTQNLFEPHTLFNYIHDCNEPRTIKRTREKARPKKGGSIHIDPNHYSVQPGKISASKREKLKKMFETYNLKAVAGNLHDKLPNESQSFNDEAVNKSSSIPQKLEQHPFACNIFQDVNKKAALNINVSVEKKHLERNEPLIALNASKFVGPVSPTFAYSKNMNQTDDSKGNVIFFKDNGEEDTGRSTTGQGHLIKKQTSSHNVLTTSFFHRNRVAESSLFRGKNGSHVSSYFRRWNHGLNAELAQRQALKRPYNLTSYITTNAFAASQGEVVSFLSFEQKPQYALECLKQQESRTLLNEYAPLFLAITQNVKTPLRLLLDSFWRNLCECRLMPLTTGFPTDEQKRLIRQKRKYGSQQSQAPFRNLDKKASENWNALLSKELQENLCLRLTQNFQLVSPTGTCFFEMAKKQEEEHFSLSFRDRICDIRALDSQSFQTETYYKKKEIASILKARFTYLLFNHHTRSLFIKSAFESRLFNPSSLNNLDQVANDISEASKSCVKLPELNFVLFFNKHQLDDEKSKSLSIHRGISFDEKSSPLTGGDDGFFPKQGDEISEAFEAKMFEELRLGLFNMLTRNGASTLNKEKKLQSLRNIRIIGRSTIEAKIQHELDQNSLQRLEQIEHAKNRILSSITPIASNNASNEPSSFQKEKSVESLPKKVSSFNPCVDQDMIVEDVCTNVFDDVMQDMRLHWPAGIQRSFLAVHDSPDHPGTGSRFNRLESNVSLDPHTGAPRSNTSSKNPSETSTHYIGNRRTSNLPHEDSTKTQSVVVIDNEFNQPEGEYLMEHDKQYVTGSCFHIKIQWIFSRGPLMQERFVKRLYRRVKEFCKNNFKIIPISGIIRNEELNPFEMSTDIRTPQAKLKIVKELVNRIFAQTGSSEGRSSEEYRSKRVLQDSSSRKNSFEQDEMCLEVEEAQSRRLDLNCLASYELPAANKMVENRSSKGEVCIGGISLSPSPISDDERYLQSSDKKPAFSLPDDFDARTSLMESSKLKSSYDERLRVDQRSQAHSMDDQNFLAAFEKKDQLEQLKLYHTLALQEQVFNVAFRRLLCTQCFYVHDCTSQSVKSQNFLQTTIGLGYVRVYDDNRVAFLENDLVSNTLTENTDAIRAREKVQNLIVCLDILLEIAFASI